jgi:outer membrane immunogenic protein
MRNVILSALAVSMIAAPAMAQSFSAPIYYGTLGYTQVDRSDADLGAVTGRFGARMTPNFGAEGEVSFGVRDDDATIAGVPVTLKHKYDAALYGVAALPVTPNFELFGRVGYGTTEVEAKAAGVSASADGESWNYGVGANYFLDGVNGVRGDWTRRDFRDGGETDVYSINYVRRF